MTKTEFKNKFFGISNRECEYSSLTGRPAPWPPFIGNAINIEKIEHECRDKWARISLDEKNQVVNVEWETQEECIHHDLLDAEIMRCMKHIGFKGRIEVNLFDRDGAENFVYDLEV